MKSTNFFIKTFKNSPSDAELISHKLLLKAGFIHKLASGLYSYLPMGLRSLKKIETIIRKHMNAISLEVLLPIVQPSSLWEESGRLDKYGKELLRFSDRHDAQFCLGPTHEEVIVDLAKSYLKSYKDLPVSFYQINTKFRDEIRPRFGLLRAREFVMKDAYSFHAGSHSLDATYELMRQSYIKIFDELSVDYSVVSADNGQIGGSGSEEFHILADSGEDFLIIDGDKAYNVETISDTLKKTMINLANSGELPSEIEVPNLGIRPVKKGIEIGHIFKLGDTYTRSMGLTIADDTGKNFYPTMGCYGIGVSRILSAVVEQKSSETSFVLPPSIAPFECAILPINYHKSEQVRHTADQLYSHLSSKYDCLLDDRLLRFGEMINDLELVGIPHIYIINEKNTSLVEVRDRMAGFTSTTELSTILNT